MFHSTRRSMTISEFAMKHCLKVVTDSCGALIVPSQLGKDANISDYSDEQNDGLAMCWITDGKNARTGLWNRTKVKCLAAGMRLHREGDAEGIFVFNPADPVQARLAIKMVKARAKRQMTPQVLARLANVGFKGRKHTEEGQVST
jgi:hypothetical protein